MPHLLDGLARVEVEVDEGGEQAGGDQQQQRLQQTILQHSPPSIDFFSNLNLEVGAGGGCGDNLVNHSLVAVEQPEEEVDGEEGEVEGEEEQSLEQEGAQGDEDAGGADVEVDHEAQPGVVGLHRVGGEAEEEGEGEHQEERHHQDLLATLHQELLGLLGFHRVGGGRGGRRRGLLLVKELILGCSPLLALASAP